MAGLNEHRIEWIFKTPEGRLETLTISVSGNVRADRLATLTKQIRTVLEGVMAPEAPLTLEHCRDYPVTH